MGRHNHRAKLGPVYAERNTARRSYSSRSGLRRPFTPASWSRLLTVTSLYTKSAAAVTAPASSRRPRSKHHLGQHVDRARQVNQSPDHRDQHKARQGDQGTRAGWERSRFRTANLEASDLGVHRSGWITVVVSNWRGTSKYCRSRRRRSNAASRWPPIIANRNSAGSPSAMFSTTYTQKSCRQAPR
jgi:hypothetical protein